jgi:regulator of protease activity HflC (stomatin/prohibitin superfamily)
VSATQEILNAVGDSGVGISKGILGLGAGGVTAGLGLFKAIHQVPENHVGVRTRFGKARRPETTPLLGRIISRDTRLMAVAGRNSRLNAWVNRPLDELYGLGDKRGLMFNIPGVESVVDVSLGVNSNQLPEIMVNDDNGAQLFVQSAIYWSVKFNRETRDQDEDNPRRSLYEVNSGVTKIKNKDEDKGKIGEELAQAVAYRVTGGLWSVMTDAKRPETDEDRQEIDQKIKELCGPLLLKYGIEIQRVEIQTATETLGQMIKDAGPSLEAIMAATAEAKAAAAELEQRQTEAAGAVARLRLASAQDAATQ